MKTHLKAALASVMILGAGAAAAADMPSAKYLPMAPALPSFYNWTGFYVGAQAGYSWGTDTTTELLTANRGFINAFDYHPESVLGGVHAGFNYQMGSFVVGIEGDVDAMNARSGFHDPSQVRSPFDPGGLVRVQQDWQASVRARLGFALDRFMVYGTAGVAFSEFQYSYFNPLAGFGEGGSFSRTGWTVGGGVNYAMTNNLILGVDYRYTDYGKFDYVANSAFLGLTAEQSPTTHQVRASIAYKF
jgi:outer membrane immunogenic protein